MTTTFHDWRGTEIKVGSTAIVSDHFGGAMAHAEFEISGVDAGQVEIRVVRLTDNIKGPLTVPRIPISWVTIVDGFPESQEPTAAEVAEGVRLARLARYEERLAQLDAGAEPVFIREREITLTRIEKIRAARPVDA